MKRPSTCFDPSPCIIAGASALLAVSRLYESGGATGIEPAVSIEKRAVLVDLLPAVVPLVVGHVGRLAAGGALDVR